MVTFFQKLQLLRQEDRVLRILRDTHSSGRVNEMSINCALTQIYCSFCYNGGV